MSIFEVIIRKNGELERVFYNTKNEQAVRRHLEFLGYEVIFIKKVTEAYISAID